MANGEHNADGSEYPTAEALTAAIDAVWGDGWNVDYAGCGEDEDDGDSRAHIDFTWSQCDGCHSQLGGSRCVGFAWRIRPHTFEVARFTGAVVCSVCGLLPLDGEDEATPCLLPATV